MTAPIRRAVVRAELVPSLNGLVVVLSLLLLALGASSAQASVDLLVGHAAKIGEDLTTDDVRGSIATSPSRHGLSIGLEGSRDRVLLVGRLYNRERRSARLVLFGEVLMGWLEETGWRAGAGAGAGLVLPFLDVTRFRHDFNLNLVYGLRVYPGAVRLHAGLLVGF